MENNSLTLVLGRLERHVRAGHELRVRYSPDQCLLLAVEVGQLPFVILRATRREFEDLHSALMVACRRALKTCV